MRDSLDLVELTQRQRVTLNWFAVSGQGNWRHTSTNTLHDLAGLQTLGLVERTSDGVWRITAAGRSAIG